MRFRPSPAMAVAIVALIFSMSGSALAAKHYLLSSTKQISPSVRSALKGSVGPAGPQGTPGTAGPAGAAGAAGARGAAGATGAKGDKGDRGDAGADGSAYAYGFISKGGALSDSFGSLSVTHPSTGVYCVKGMDADNISVTLGSDGLATTTFAETGSVSPCPSSSSGSIFTAIGQPNGDITYADNDVYFSYN